MAPYFTDKRARQVETTFKFGEATAFVAVMLMMVVAVPAVGLFALVSVPAGAGVACFLRKREPLMTLITFDEPSQAAVDAAIQPYDEQMKRFMDELKMHKKQ
jgi:hypothetical protein